MKSPGQADAFMGDATLNGRSGAGAAPPRVAAPPPSAAPPQPPPLAACSRRRSGSTWGSPSKRGLSLSKHASLFWGRQEGRGSAQGARGQGGGLPHPEAAHAAARGAGSLLPRPRREALRCPAPPAPPPRALPRLQAATLKLTPLSRGSGLAVSTNGSPWGPGREAARPWCGARERGCRAAAQRVGPAPGACIRARRAPMPSACVSPNTPKRVVMAEAAGGGARSAARAAARCARRARRACAARGAAWRAGPSRSSERHRAARQRFARGTRRGGTRRKTSPALTARMGVTGGWNGSVRDL
jgi:hypothetical protein